MADAPLKDDDTATTPGGEASAEADDVTSVPSRTAAGIERREREKPLILAEIPACLAYFGAEPSDWEVRRELWGLDWTAGEKCGVLLKAAALWLPGEPGALSLRCVRLRTNALTRRGIPGLVAGLDPVYATRGANRWWLLELDLAENSLGGEGVRLLCDGLKAHRYGGLERLDVSGNKIGVAGGAALAGFAASDYGKRLECLLASRNNLFDDGVGEFGKVGFGRLELLDVRENFFGARGAAALANGFEKNATLTALNVYGNTISLEGLWALGNALKNKRKNHFRAQEKLRDRYETVPKKERWKVLAERDGWTEQEILDADAAPPLKDTGRKEGESQKDYVKRRLAQIAEDKDAPPDDAEHDPLYGKRKENLIVGDAFVHAPYTYDVFFFGMDIRPRPLFRRVFGHHIIGALDSVLCAIS